MIFDIFLQSLTGATDSVDVNTGLAGALLALGAIILLIVLVVLIAIYVYMSFAYMAIAKKAKLHSPGLAWIPFFGPLIIANQASKMHWWPFLLFLSILTLIIPFIGLFIFFVCMVIFIVMHIIWEWKMFEAIKKPGWFAILMLIGIVNFIVLGIAAWSD
ncbi:hypothetical protein COU57_00390 [Candidatus Pacearchaeota archaeon CG10_big_fil_rev_8_21_14_0_10_32_14]|nr:MAG: hypothetical protein COU57_00390 [Candidatus Pacearchaeota archaeon CG10_big_fil_rev_8_21_14_0_10_32_14]